MHFIDYYKNIVYFLLIILNNFVMCICHFYYKYNFKCLYSIVCIINFSFSSTLTE